MIRKAKTVIIDRLQSYVILFGDMELDITKEITKDRIIEAIELSIVNVDIGRL